ncbi:MAG: dockerin type I domain-containing protein [Bacillota bacterium]
MSFLLRQKFSILHAVIVACLILCLIPAGLSAAPEANLDRTYLEDFSSISRQVSEEQLSPTRTVMQIIDNRFYKWQEYEHPITGKVAIYLLEPHESALSRDRAHELLKLSGQWGDYIPHNQSYQPGKRAESSIYSSQEASMEVPDENNAPSRETTNLPGGMTDDRTEINIRDAETYPYKTIGFLTTDFPYELMRGTGFLVTPHVALTNAHNIYSPQFGGWYRTIRFSPGQYEDSNMDIINPYSTLNPDKTVVNSTFKNYEDQDKRDKAINHDYGAIFFENQIDTINTFMPLEFNHLPETVSLLGYPGNVRGNLTLGMWLSQGNLIRSDEFCLYYEAYTSGGNSGSPVFVYNETAATYRVVAIHSFASINYFSGGPHLNDNNRDIIEEWMRWVPESEAESPPADEEETVQDEQEAMEPGLKLNKTELRLIENDDKTLIVTVNNEDISGNELVWISNNPQIATVENNGIVTAVREGKTTVKVMTPDGRVEAGCEVTVIKTTGGRLPGDINDDNLIDVQDVVMVTRHILNYTELDQNQMQATDVNGDGKVDVNDVTKIMQFALGLIDTL